MQYSSGRTIWFGVFWVAFAALSAVTGCGGDLDAPDDFEVVGARLDNVYIAEAGVAMGYVWGGADLVVNGRNGEQVVWPVQFDGALFGIVGGAWTPGQNLECEFTLPGESDAVGGELPDPPDTRHRDDEIEPDDVVTTDELLGTYTGWSIGLAVLYGGHVRHLENDHGVVITPSFFMQGIGILWVIDRLTISLAD